MPIPSPLPLDDFEHAIQADPEVLGVFYFGSLGRGAATKGSDRYCCSQVGRYNTQPRHDERGWLCSAFGVDVNGHDAMVRHGSVASAGAATPVAAASPPARRVPSRTMAFPMT